MSEYSIRVSKGKVIGNSAFFTLAYDSMDKEVKRLCEFTDTLDQDPIHKKNCIAEYKCAKYRYASVSLISTTVWHNNRARKDFNIEYSHYVLGFFDEILKSRPEYLSLYETAPANEKPDYSLYYAMLAFTERELEDLESKLHNATDWEKVELEERIGGLLFAKECLDEAWKKRKEAVE